MEAREGLPGQGPCAHGRFLVSLANSESEDKNAVSVTPPRPAALDVKCLSFSPSLSFEFAVSCEWPELSRASTGVDCLFTEVSVKDLGPAWSRRALASA